MKNDLRTLIYRPSILTRSLSYRPLSYCPLSYRPSLTRSLSYRPSCKSSKPSSYCDVVGFIIALIITSPLLILAIYSWVCLWQVIIEICEIIIREKR